MIAKLSLSLTYVWSAIVAALVFVVGIGILMIFILLFFGVGLFNLAERLRQGRAPQSGQLDTAVWP